MKRARVLLAAATAISVAVGLSCADIIGITDVPDGATASGDAQTDVAPLQMCDPLAAFDGPPTNVPGLLAMDMGFAALSQDEKTAYLCQVSANQTSLMVATRPSPDASFGIPTAVPGSNGVCEVTVSGDLKQIVWVHWNFDDAGMGTDSQLYSAERATAAVAFDFAGGTAIAFDEAGTYLDSPFLRADGQQLYFRDNTFGLRHASADAGFHNAAGLTGLPASARFPVVSPDGLVLYYAVVPTQMRVAVRSSTAANFGNTQVLSLPDAGNNPYYPILISADYCTLYIERRTDSYGLDGSDTPSNTVYILHKTPP